MKCDTKSFANKVNRFLSTKKGKKLLGKARSLDEGEVRRLTVTLAKKIISSMPESLSDVADKLSPESMISVLKLPDGSYVSAIKFPSDVLRRESLIQPDGSQDGGVDNIIALFNNGYKARGSVFGLWASHEKSTWSVDYREPLHFMQEAVSSFLQEVPSGISAEVELNPIYNE